VKTPVRGKKRLAKRDARSSSSDDSSDTTSSDDSDLEIIDNTGN